MKQQQRLDKILDAIERRTQDEVGGLLGTVFVLSNGVYEHVTKEDAFDDLQGKQIAAEMDIVGDVTGKGSLLLGIKDAIRLGGTLIMLPDAELDEFIAREDYSEEIEDSYGEIANIVAGSFTKEFEEMYSKACRFVRKEQAVLQPVKVDIESDIPVENRQLYRATWSMSLDGTPMGKMVMLVPAATFDLEKEVEPKPSAEASVEPVADAAPESETGTPVEQAPDSSPPPPRKPKIDYEKQKKRVDKLLDECHHRMQNEIGGLLGVTAVMSGLKNYFVRKEGFFEDHVSGKQVIANMEVVGDLQDYSYFCVSLRDAIHLGGVLIMLPPTELEAAASAEDFSDDSADAYGEIANIVSGVYTAVFEEQYTKKLRFIKKGLTQVQPAKVETESAEPIPDNLYYVNSLDLSVDGTELGRVQMLFPAEMLDLFPPEFQPAAEAGETAKQQAGGDALEKEAMKAPGVATAGTEPAATPAAPRIDAKKHKVLVDKLLGRCQETMQDEVSSLLGADVEFKNIDNKIVDKETFFVDEVSGKQVLANLDVGGDLEGLSYLSIELRDAIRFGGILIMLPGSELESVVSEEDFGEDTADAYGEIANIIAGVYTAVFEEQYTKSLRFVRKEVQQVAPMKVDVESDEPIPNQNYYVSQMDVVVGGNGYGKINLLFPLHLLELQGLLEKESDQEVVEVQQDAGSASFGEDVVAGGGSDSGERKPADLLIIGDDVAAAALISSTVEELGYTVKTLSYKDNLHNFLPGQVKAVYLVMANVNEQGFGTAIKISTACKLPLVAAGPGWTKSKVIKAVKYGVSDILLTPASPDAIKKNVETHVLQKAA